VLSAVSNRSSHSPLATMFSRLKAAAANAATSLYSSMAYTLRIYAGDLTC